jgi:predicted nucleic acid-binding protein
VIGLLDTSIIVDLLREHKPAELWLQSQGQLGVARTVWIEILEGAPNLRKQREAIKLLKHFDLIEHSLEDWIWATRMLTQ